MKKKRKSVAYFGRSDRITAIAHSLRARGNSAQTLETRKNDVVLEEADGYGKELRQVNEKGRVRGGNDVRN